MPYDPNRHHRRSIRLRGYDYASASAYFVTICTQGHELLFGVVVEGAMHLDDVGRMVESVWMSMPARFPGVTVVPYIIMPNHFHAVLVLSPADASDGAAADGPTTRDAPTGTIRPTLGDVVGAFKSITTREYVAGVRTRGWRRFDRRLWQRNYWEHIIRTPESYAKIQEYIVNNPRTWRDDSLNPDRSRDGVTATSS